MSVSHETPSVSRIEASIYRAGDGEAGPSSLQRPRQRNRWSFTNALRGTIRRKSPSAVATASSSSETANGTLTLSDTRPNRPVNSHDATDPYLELRAWSDGHIAPSTIANGPNGLRSPVLRAGQQQRESLRLVVPAQPEPASSPASPTTPSSPLFSRFSLIRRSSSMSGSSRRLIRSLSKDLPPVPGPTDGASAATPPRNPRPSLQPDESYSLLLQYQAASGLHPTSSSSSVTGSGYPSGSTASPSISHSSPYASIPETGTPVNPDPEWHEIVDAGLVDSLSPKERKRQGLWWELIKGEREYVRDLKIVCEAFIDPLLTHDPPLLVPETRLSAFIAEVFSSTTQIFLAHSRLLQRLMERQRAEWPLITSASDLLLGTFLEAAELYETYMKNYPFAEARVRRESETNEGFRVFLEERNSDELTQKRNVSVLLSRPVTRLPRILLLLDALLQCTPEDHPDREEIPTVSAVLTSVVKASQPGIESAEAKITLWNVAERLLFRKGEIIDLDIAEPKRTLVHAGRVYRRVRNETHWQGWQDLHGFLLDNYLLLTKEVEDGQFVVVSRPIHLDFLTLVLGDAPPERRYDLIKSYRRLSNGGEDLGDSPQPEKLLYPLTFSTAPTSPTQTLTLCMSSQHSRDRWRRKFENAKTMRHFDLESNRQFAVHSISIPRSIESPVVSADCFMWLGRETVAMATATSVFIGWRRDSTSMRELVRFSHSTITAVTSLVDFGVLVVLTGTQVASFDLRELIPASDPLTWVSQSGSHAVKVNKKDRPVAWMKAGCSKGRTLLVHAAHLKSTHQTYLSFDEPLDKHLSGSRHPFRHFAQLVVPGLAKDIAFFRQTIALVTDKGFVIAEPGNSSSTAVPILPATLSDRAPLVKMLNEAKPLGMHQVNENEFILAYDRGACFVNKFGEICRDGAYMRWGLQALSVAFKPPYALLFEVEGDRIVVRDFVSGRMCEVVEETGMRRMFSGGADAPILALGPRGVLELVETVELNHGCRGP